MEIQEILDYNKRCAEFLGWKNDAILLSKQIEKNTGICHLLYHSDWNWIMEVKNAIVKLNLSISPSIHRLYFNVFACNKNHKEEFIYKVRIHSDFKELEFKSQSNNEKEAVTQAINQFLIWYEQNL